MILRARTVLPITAPAIQNGAVVVSGNRISAVGSWPEIRSKFSGEEIIDLGEVVLLPGLVNAHCHLDYTDMAGLWPPPKKFTDWIPRMLAAKAEWSYTDYARSWLDGRQNAVAVRHHHRRRYRSNTGTFARSMGGDAFTDHLISGDDRRSLKTGTGTDPRRCA